MSVKRESTVHGWNTRLDGHWIWTGVTKKQRQRINMVVWNEFNISNFSTLFFLRLITRLKHGSSNKRVKLKKKIEGKITSKWSEEKQKLRYFELAGGSSYWGQNYSKCMKEIQGNSTLVRVSSRFEFVASWMSLNYHKFRKWSGLL